MQIERLKKQISLWEAVHKYVYACGGNPSISHGHGQDEIKMNAVVEIENIAFGIEKPKTAKQVKKDGVVTKTIVKVEKNRGNPDARKCFLHSWAENLIVNLQEVEKHGNTSESN